VRGTFDSGDLEEVAERRAMELLRLCRCSERLATRSKTVRADTLNSLLTLRENRRNDRSFHSETISRANVKHVFTWFELPTPAIARNVLP
jgi:hypothetical protein